MKLILPILICSAISAGLGYYFGHITLAAPSSGETVASAPASPQPQQAPAPVQPAPVVQPEPVAAPAPETASAPTPEPEPSEPETAGEEDTSFAERAAQSVHTLTDTQGRSIEATILEVTRDRVRIRRADGLETTIQLNMLVPEDIAFCNYLREQEEAAAPSTPSGGFDWESYFSS